MHREAVLEAVESFSDGEYAHAEKLLLKAVEVSCHESTEDPAACFCAHKDLGFLYILQGKLEDAWIHIDAALAIHDATCCGIEILEPAFVATIGKLRSLQTKLASPPVAGLQQSATDLHFNDVYDELVKIDDAIRAMSADIDH